ncbi:MAG: hypothetical protein IZT57_04140 [Chloroflexi bacterium]|jgi:hypothetical protein|nr:hypothetical protein [Chloroflexota bacterium]
MGKRDFRHHEAKKTKKSAKNTLTPSQIIQAPPVVELVKKKRKKSQEDEV